MAEITCICEKTFEADIPDSIDLNAEPGAASRILDGSYLTLTCPHCGNIIKPEFPIHVTNDEHGIDVFLVPEVERDRYLAGLTEYTGYNRVVIGFPELAEKLRIAADGLDDRAIEILKFYLLAKAGPGAEPKIYYRSRNDGKLMFEILGLREGEVGNAALEESLYRRSLAELPVKEKEEPFSVFLEPPYVSVSKIELEVDGD